MLMLYVTTTGAKLYAVDGETGDVIWSSGTGSGQAMAAYPDPLESMGKALARAFISEQ